MTGRFQLLSKWRQEWDSRANELMYLSTLGIKCAGAPPFAFSPWESAASEGTGSAAALHRGHLVDHGLRGLSVVNRSPLLLEARASRPF